MIWLLGKLSIEQRIKMRDFSSLSEPSLYKIYQFLFALLDSILNITNERHK